MILILIWFYLCGAFIFLAWLKECGANFNKSAATLALIFWPLAATGAFLRVLWVLSK